MTVPRWGQVAVRLNDGRVLIMGGTVPFVGKCAMACIELPTASVEAYDPRTGKFSPNGSLAVPLTDGEALLLNDGRVLVAGDPGGYGGALNTIEIYDSAKGSSVVVKPTAGMQELPTNTAVVLLADGRVLIAGGSYDSGITSSNVTLIFDPTSGGFSNGPLMARPRQGATATLLDDGRVLIVAGDDGYNGDAQDLAELIDPSHPLSQSTWPVSPGSSTSTLLSDGRVLVAGGGTEVSEVFDPRTERFTVVGPMITSRTGSAAIKIQDGRVLLLGGVDSNRAAIGTVEAFDPDSGTFQVISTAFPKITDFSATLLDDGEILIVGGVGGVGDQRGMKADSWLLKP
jgi:WD40 repeat protein